MKKLLKNKLTSLGLAAFGVLMICGNVQSQQASPTPSRKDAKELRRILDGIDNYNPNDLELSAKSVNDKNNPNEKSLRVQITQKPNNDKGIKKKVLLDVDLADYEPLSIEAEPPPEYRETSCGELKSVRLTQVGLTKIWQVEDLYVYTGTPQKPAGFTITIPRGTRYDRASIPRALTVILTKDELGTVPPLLHDYLYRHGGRLPSGSIEPSSRVFTRLQSDTLLRTALEQCGASWTRAWLAFQAVQKGGCFGSWKGTSCD